MFYEHTPVMMKHQKATTCVLVLALWRAMPHAAKFGDLSLHVVSEALSQ